MPTRRVYIRKDGRWAWQLISNGDVIATDGGQGYENEDDCRAMADAVIAGDYADADKKVNRTLPN